MKRFTFSVPQNILLVSVLSGQPGSLAESYGYPAPHERRRTVGVKNPCTEPALQSATFCDRRKSIGGRLWNVQLKHS